MKRTIILASASPRRKEILTAAGYDFIVNPADVDEGNVKGSPHEIVMELAYRKAMACARDLNNAAGGKLCDGDFPSCDNQLVIGSDTLVFLDNAQMGKPANKDAWEEAIRSLSGRSHSVITGVCLIWDDNVYKFYAKTDVEVAKLSDEEIEEYIARDEDMDKAGGYAIQGFFAKYIPSINGEYNNVVGFPVAEFARVLKEQEINI